jgi:hypothetical protein
VLNQLKMCCCSKGHRHNFNCKIFMSFLAHLSWKLKWAFLIACCPSSVCMLDFYIFNLPSSGSMLTKVGTNHL